jgi:YD repeat-containing protein
LKPLGSGDVKVSLEYKSVHKGDLTWTGAQFEGDLAATGATLEWPDPSTADYGLAEVTRILVYKKDASGAWRVVIDQAPGYGTNEIQVTAPPDPSTYLTLELRPAASTNEADWAAAALIPFGTSYRYDARGLASGNYAYRVRTAQAGSALRVVAAGVIGITQGIQFQSVAQNGERIWPRPTVTQKTDRWGNVTEVSDPRASGWKTSYEYNARNQLVRQVQPDAAGTLSANSPVTEICYDRLGRQVAVKDANGGINKQAYDAGGNQIREYRADGGVVAYEYDAFGQKVRAWDAENHAVDFTYDKAGHLLSTAKGIAGIYRADQGGMKRLVLTQNVTDRWTYDQLGRKLSQANGNGETVRYAYDLRGNLTAATQPLGQMARTAYDTENRKVGETDANGLTSSWNYDWRGLLVAHRDLDRHAYTYAYDNARQLTAQGSSFGQSLQYTYDGAGQLTRIADSVLNKVSTYSYDEAGRKVRETVTQADRTYQDNHLSYDALGNLRDIADARVHMVLEYDKVGNRTRITSSWGYQNSDGAYGSDKFFRYDQMNRQTVVDAVDAAGNLGQQGHRLTYDRNGNRTSDTFWGNRVHTVGGEPMIVGYNPADDTAIYGTAPVGFIRDSGDTTETYRYDVLNRLTSVVRDGMQIDVRFYDGADRLVQTGPAAGLPLVYADLLNQAVPASDTNGKEIRAYRYDDNGRVMHQRVLKTDWTEKMDILWDPASPPVIERGLPYKAEGYDDAGNVRSYVVQNHVAGQVNKFTTKDMWRFDGYLAKTIEGTSSVSRPGTTLQSYDVNGFLVGVTDSTAPANSRTFVNDASGRALFVDQGGKIQRQLIVNGEVLGIYGAAPQSSGSNPTFANLADFDFGYARITSSYPNPSPGAYQVRSGDTLQSIAQGAYGDSALWYRIAEANGLASSNDLKVGQTLNIPNRVSTIHNNTSTFKPYDPSRIEGDKTPDMAMPKSDSGCGGVGKVLMVIVAVLVSCFVGPGPLAAVLSSLASQAVGLATGAIDRFSWTSLALSVVSQGMASGMEGAFQGLGSFAPLARAAVANAATQGIAVATGLQKKFDWRGVAASAVGAGVAQEVASPMARAFERVPGGAFAAAMATSLVAGSSAALVRGGRVAIQQVAIDAFGNALGSSLASAGSSAGPQQSLTNGDFVRMNTAQQSFRLEEISQQNERARAEAMYGWNTGNDGLGFKPVAGVGTVGMRYQGVRSAMFDDARVFSDSRDPNALVNVGQDGSPTAQVPPLFNPTAAGGARAGIVGGGYQVVRPRGAGGAPGYDIVRDLPAGAPGYSQANPSLGLGAPPKLADGPSWLDFTNPGLLLPVRTLGGLLDSLIFKSPSQKLGEALEAAGYQRPAASAAHHIVPEADARAADIRQRLKEWDIGINTADNGVFLPHNPGSQTPGAYHPKLNNEDYYRQLERDFSGVNTRQRAVDTLNDIRGRLLNGTYPGSRPVPPKQ